jgi:hypothetical protein
VIPIVILASTIIYLKGNHGIGHMSIVLTRPPKKEPTPLMKWAWVLADAGYRLKTPEVLATLKPVNDKEWGMSAKIVGRWYTGSRPSLEEAFKVLDRAIHQHAIHTWLNTDVHAVIDPWMGNLEGLETLVLTKPSPCVTLTDEDRERMGIGI